MKFTEEQYQKIVDAWDFEDTYAEATQAVVDVISVFGGTELLQDEALAIANQLTRDWAHEQYVEKEKKYVWRLKSDNDLVISKWSSGWFADEFPTDNMYFSEKEIENSPFKHECFDKVEVK